MVPVAGSAYTYAYATLGELFAWIIGWDLVLEYAVGLGHGGARLVELLPGLHRHLRHPGARSSSRRRRSISIPQRAVSWQRALWSDLPAIVIALVVTVILVIGIRESAGFNTVMVVIKVAVVLFVIVVGAFYVDPGNWQPFAPYGWTGIKLLRHNGFRADRRPAGRPWACRRARR